MIGKIIFIIFLILAAGLIAYFSYSIYQNFYSPVKNFNATLEETKPSYNSSLQFYPNMRFDHNKISYFISDLCDEKRTENIKSAFSIIDSKVSALSFHLDSENSDIILTCSDENIEEGEDMFRAGMGGVEGDIPYTGEFYIIPNGNVTIYQNINCNTPIVEIHEILHSLGFVHSENENSIMYPVSSCNEVITNDIVLELERLYLIQALPDLYFTNVSASKQGSYLNLEFSVRNKGIINAENVSVILYAENNEKDRFNLGKIEPGAGKIYSVKNEKVPSSSQIFKLKIIDGEELNKENNEIILTLS